MTCRLCGLSNAAEYLTDSSYHKSYLSLKTQSFRPSYLSLKTQSFRPRSYRSLKTQSFRPRSYLSLKPSPSDRGPRPYCMPQLQLPLVQPFIQLKKLKENGAIMNSFHAAEFEKYLTPSKSSQEGVLHCNVSYLQTPHTFEILPRRSVTLQRLLLTDSAHLRNSPKKECYTATSLTYRLITPSKSSQEGVLHCNVSYLQTHHTFEILPRRSVTLQRLLLTDSSHLRNPPKKECYTATSLTYRLITPSKSSQEGVLHCNVSYLQTPHTFEILPRRSVTLQRLLLTDSSHLRNPPKKECYTATSLTYRLITPSKSSQEGVLHCNVSYLQTHHTFEILPRRSVTLQRLLLTDSSGVLHCNVSYLQTHHTFLPRRSVTLQRLLLTDSSHLRNPPKKECYTATSLTYRLITPSKSSQEGVLHCNVSYLQTHHTFEILPRRSVTLQRLLLTDSSHLRNPPKKECYTATSLTYRLITPSKSSQEGVLHCNVSYLQTHHTFEILPRRSVTLQRLLLTDSSHLRNPPKKECYTATSLTYRLITPSKSKSSQEGMLHCNVSYLQTHHTFEILPRRSVTLQRLLLTDSSHLRNPPKKECYTATSLTYRLITPSKSSQEGVLHCNVSYLQTHHTFEILPRRSVTLQRLLLTDSSHLRNPPKKECYTATSLTYRLITPSKSSQEGVLHCNVSYLQTHHTFEILPRRSVTLQRLLLTDSSHLRNPPKKECYTATSLTYRLITPSKSSQEGVLHCNVSYLQTHHTFEILPRRSVTLQRLLLTDSSHLRNPPKKECYTATSLTYRLITPSKSSQEGVLHCNVSYLQTHHTFEILPRRSVTLQRLLLTDSSHLRNPPKKECYTATSLTYRLITPSKSSQEGVLHCNVSYLQTHHTFEILPRRSVTLQRLLLTDSSHLRNPPKKECYTASLLLTDSSHLRNPPKKECYTATSLTYRLITPSKSSQEGVLHCNVSYLQTHHTFEILPRRSVTLQRLLLTDSSHLRNPPKKECYTATSLTYRLLTHSKSSQEGVLHCNVSYLQTHHTFEILPRRSITLQRLLLTDSSHLRNPLKKECYTATSLTYRLITPSKSSQEGVLHCNVSYLQTHHTFEILPRRSVTLQRLLLTDSSHLRNPPKKECYTATSLTYRLITPSKSSQEGVLHCNVSYLQTHHTFEILPIKECYTATSLTYRLITPSKSSQEGVLHCNVSYLQTHHTFEILPRRSVTLQRLLLTDSSHLRNPPKKECYTATSLTYRLITTSKSSQEGVLHCNVSYLQTRHTFEILPRRSVTLQRLLLTDSSHLRNPPKKACYTATSLTYRLITPSKSSQEGVLHCNFSYLQTHHTFEILPRRSVTLQRLLLTDSSHLRNPPKKECYTATSLTYRLITPSKSSQEGVLHCNVSYLIPRSCFLFWIFSCFEHFTVFLLIS